MVNPAARRENAACTIHLLARCNKSCSQSEAHLYIDIHQFKVYLLDIMRNSDPQLDTLLHAVADPTRRRILQALKTPSMKAGSRQPGLCASDIEGRIRLSQPTISHHMTILEKAGLVESTKQSQWRWYRRNEGALRAFFRKLRETL